VVHPTCELMLICYGWEASLPDVGLNKSVRVALALRPFPKRTIPSSGEVRPSTAHKPQLTRSLPGLLVTVSAIMLKMGGGLRFNT